MCELERDGILADEGDEIVDGGTAITEEGEDVIEATVFPGPEPSQRDDGDEEPGADCLDDRNGGKAKKYEDECGYAGSGDECGARDEDVYACELLLEKGCDLNDCH